MNSKTRALKVKSESGENKVDMGFMNRNGIRRLSSKEQADKSKTFPIVGERKSQLKEKLIRKGHGFLKF